ALRGAPGRLHRHAGPDQHAHRHHLRHPGAHHPLRRCAGHRADGVAGPGDPSRPRTAVPRRLGSPMTSVTTAPAPRDDVVEDTGARRHALTVAGLCIAAGLAAVVLFGLTATSDQVSTLLMNPRGVDTIPDVELPTQIAAFVLGFGA